MTNPTQAALAEAADARSALDRVRDRILADVRAGVLKPGRVIAPAALAADLGLAEDTVRALLGRLVDEGFLHGAAAEGAPEGGLAIRELGETEVLDLYNARAGIEGFSARLLAERNDPALNRRLLDVIGGAARMDARSEQAYFDANHMIHRSIVSATDNAFLLGFFDNLWRRGACFGLFASIDKVDVGASLAEHTALVEAIATGDGAMAAERMIAHVRDGYFLFLDARQDSPF
ncbi:MAG: GntR family transcriptional regulator [Rhodobacteraceae bacterium]|nr:GntR family transcriptional regulator [Paracoccaceae bacterium]